MIAGTRHGLVVSKLFDASTEGGLAQSITLSLSKYKPPRLTMRQRTTGGRVNILFWFPAFGLSQSRQVARPAMKPTSALWFSPGR
ncbi:hypothetical protein BU251_00615 [Candidatus Velamenicoccus archaeovorus]|uniref:Uncharacterized protein n=1 Tax=Velamenicoccus archaeovorus TaxID=1930593 RepID=A0A410P2M6_VELA1|nr:hypothetical protein BU251_00615 [Candidatus Velamenicoccus archaeovorus]